MAFKNAYRSAAKPICSSYRWQEKKQDFQITPTGMSSSSSTNEYLPRFTGKVSLNGMESKKGTG